MRKIVFLLIIGIFISQLVFARSGMKASNPTEIITITKEIKIPSFQKITIIDTQTKTVLDKLGIRILSDVKSNTFQITVPDTLTLSIIDATKKIFRVTPE